MHISMDLKSSGGIVPDIIHNLVDNFFVEYFMYAFVHEMRKKSKFSQQNAAHFP